MKEAIEFDKENGNTLWQDAIRLELDQLCDFDTFRVVPDGEILPEDYKRIPYMFVFDVKFDLRRKARLVAGGHLTDTPKDDCFS